MMKTIYILQTSEQNPSSAGVQFTCRAEAKRAYYDAYHNSPVDGGFASLSEIFPSNTNAMGYSERLILNYETGIYKSDDNNWEYAFG